MIFGVPVLLIVCYALFRVFEYFGLNIQKAVYGAGPRPETNRPLLILGAILLPARVFAWIALVYYGYTTSWLAPVKLVVMAYPVSLVRPFFFAALLPLPPRVGTGVVLTAIPAFAVAIILILTSL